MAATDLFVIPALFALWASYRLRSRLGKPLLGVALPVGTLPLVVFAGYWLWYVHRPQPAPVQRELASGITYSRIPKSDPRPLVVHCVEIDLTTPGLEFVVTPHQPIDDFDLPARKTTQFVEEFDVDVAINANFFYPFRGKSPFDYYPRVSQPIKVIGSCVSEGKWYSKPFDCKLLSITKDNRAAIGEPKNVAWNGVSGRPVLLRDGQIEEDLPSDGSQPRTAIALDRSGRRMCWLIIDGRQPGYSEGVTFAELASECLALGGWDAVALDGGGSSTVAIRNAQGKGEVLNCPIHGRHPPGVERPVANHLGARIKRTPRP